MECDNLLQCASRRSHTCSLSQSLFNTFPRSLAHSTLVAVADNTFDGEEVDEAVTERGREGVGVADAMTTRLFESNLKQRRNRYDEDNKNYIFLEERWGMREREERERKRKRMGAVFEVFSIRSQSLSASRFS